MKMITALINILERAALCNVSEAIADTQDENGGGACSAEDSDLQPSSGAGDTQRERNA